MIKPKTETLIYNKPVATLFGEFAQLVTLSSALTPQTYASAGDRRASADAAADAAAMSVRRMDSLRITSQLQSEWQDSGLSFRIMLVGESGQGKSTFTRALLRPYVPDHLLHKGNPEPLCARTTEITEIVHRVDNEGYPVEFTIVDCPGYGDAIDCSPWIRKITEVRG